MSDKLHHVDNMVEELSRYHITNMQKYHIHFSDVDVTTKKMVNISLPTKAEWCICISNIVE